MSGWRLQSEDPKTNPASLGPAAHEHPLKPPAPRDRFKGLPSLLMSKLPPIMIKTERLTGMLNLFHKSTDASGSWRPSFLKPIANSLLATAVVTSLSITPSDAKPHSVSIKNEKGETITILKDGVVRVIPIYRVALFEELIAAKRSRDETRRQIESCLKTTDKYLCWKMFGQENMAKEEKFPISLKYLNVDILYIVLGYYPVITDLAEQKKLGEEGLVVCLNPAVPVGYWEIINRYKPILKNAPPLNGSDKPLDQLKEKACKTFASFKRPKA